MSKKFALLALAALTVGLEFAAAQIGFGSPATVNPAPNGVNYCEDAPEGFFEINWKTVGAVPRGEIRVLLPEGARYLGGSREDRDTRPAGITTGVSVTGDTLRFVLTDRADGDGGTIRYRLRYDCRLTAVLQEPHRLTVSAISGTDTFTVRTAPINSTASEPIVTPVPTAGTTLRNVVVGETYTRELDIVQSGQRSRAYSFILCTSYGTNLAVADQTLGGVPLSFASARGGCLDITQADYPTLPWPFEEGDRWRLRESVTPASCVGIASTIQTRFGCGPELCRDYAAVSPEILLADEPPASRILRHERILPSDGCVAEGARIEADYEVTGKVYAPQFYLRGYGEQTYIDTSTIEIDWGDGAYQPWTGGFLPREQESDCAPGRDRFLDLNPFEGLVDARDAPRRIRLRYNIKWCCEAPAGGGLDGAQIYGYYVRFRVNDQCNVAQFRDVTVGSYSLHGDGSSDFPTRIADGTTADFTVDLDELRISSEINEAASICVDYELPAGLTAAAGDSATVARFGGYRPTKLAVEDLGSGRYRACFGRDDFFGNGSTIRLPIAYACTSAIAGATVTVRATATVRLGGPSCTSADECGIRLVTVEGRVALGSECVTTACDGIEHTGATAARTTFGAADADLDGRPDVGAALDMNVVREDHAMEGDVVAVTSTALVRTAAPATTFDYVTAELRWDRPHARSSAPALEVYDASTGLTHDCGAVGVEVVDSVTYRYRLLAEGLRGCGGLPADFAFGRGDSLRLRAAFVVLDNPGCGTEEVGATLDWYADRSAAAGADRLQCNLPDLAKYQNVGYLFATDPYFTRPHGCAGTYYEYRVRFCVGGTINGSAFWPGEVRPYGTLASTALEVPPGMRLDSVHGRVLSGTRRPASARTYYDFDVTEFSRVVDGAAVTDWDAVREGTDVEMMPGGAYFVFLRGYFGGSCASARDTMTASATARFVFPAEGGLAARSERQEDRYDTPVRADIPAAQLASTTTDIAPYDHRAAWSFTLRETAGHEMPNTWVAFESPSGAIAPDTVTFRGEVIAPVDGLYRLGALTASSINELTVAVDYRNCGADSLLVRSGWDCGGYPSSAAAVLGGEVPCEPLALTLRMTPREPAIQQAIITQPSGDTEPCTDLAYEVELLNITDAVVYEPVFELFAPYTSGVEILGQTARLAYPSSATPSEADFAVPLGDPIRTTVTPLGIRYFWDLDQLLPDFDAGSDRGWGGRDVDDPNANRIRIRFDVRTNCDFIAGDNLSFIVRGRAHCGRPVRTILRNGEAIEFGGVESPYSAVHELDIPERLDVCAGDVELDGAVTFFGETDGGDRLFLALPPGLGFVGLRSAGDLLDTSVVINEIPVGTADGRTFQELRIGVNAGAESFREIRYTIVARVRPGGLLCDDLATVNLRSVRATAYECRGQTCEGLYASGALVPVPVFEIVPDTFAVSDLRLSSTCAGDSLRLDALTVANLTAADISADIVVDVYRDRDGSGGFTPGDEPVATFSARPEAASGASAVVAAGAVALAPGADALDACGLVAVVSGCACERLELPVSALRFENAGADVSTCSGGAIAVGCGEGLPGYTYAWTPAAGSPPAELADANAAQTELTYVHPERRDTVLAYVLTTTSPLGCVSADTVEVAVVGSCVTIGDYAWVDADGDGRQGADEAPLPGVAVALYDAGDDVALARATTDARGKYRFDDFPAGRYYLVFDASASAIGEGAVATVRGTDPLAAADDSDIDADGRTAAFEYAPLAGPLLDLDAGFVPGGQLAAVLSVGAFDLLGDGLAEARLRLGVRNTGGQPLAELTVDYDVAGDFGASFRGARAAPAAEQVGDITAVNAPAVAPDFDGRDATTVVAPEPGFVLGAGEGFTYDVFVRFDARGLAETIRTQANASARARVLAQALTMPLLTDRTDSGVDFFGPNPGAPGDTGGEDDPLPITCADAAVAISGDLSARCAGTDVTLAAVHPLGAGARVTWRVDGAPAVASPTLELSGPASATEVALAVGGLSPVCYYGLDAVTVVEGGRVPTLLTPDGDGVNDRFRIPCIDGLTETAIAIYNRWGDAVYESADYGNDWGGTYRDELLPEGTYFYVLTLAAPDAAPIKGYVYLRH